MGSERERQRDAPPIRLIGQGPVMPIGGAEDHTGDGGDDILIRFVDRAGGDRARIAIVPTASSEPETSGARYVKMFRDLGAEHADWIRVKRREDANGGDALRLLSEATGIFVTGGDQGRLVTLLIGTKAMECIRQRNAEGMIVAGTSAGAPILPRT